MSYAINKGVRIHHEIVGNGPPLILQHGFTQSIKDWHRAGYVEALKPHYQLILVDARGHGQSDKPHDAAAYPLSSRVNDIVAVMDSIGILRASYWGYSMGGWIGFGMAMEARARLRAIIIGGQDPYGRKMLPGPDGSDAGNSLHPFSSVSESTSMHCVSKTRSSYSQVTAALLQPLNKTAHLLRLSCPQ